MVKHSGVSTGTIYKYFKDKEGLARALMARLIDDIVVQEQAIIQAHQGGQNQYRALVTWMFEFTEDYPTVMAFLLYARHQAFLPDRESVCSSKPFLILRDVIGRSIASGEVKPMDLMVAASLAFGGVLRLIQLHLDGVLPKPLLSYRDEMITVGWQAIAQP